jgi:predicted regulator of Ras-like GTPase activity (Roadblock/LC7/MglB family)
MMNGGRPRNTDGRAGEVTVRPAPPSVPASRRRGPPPPRDQAPSSFTTILERLLRSTAGARGAALVDFEGETVDYAGHLDPFELKVAAATWQIAVSEVCATSFSAFTQIVVRAARSSFVLRRVNDQYAVVLVLHARAAFAVSSRALSEAESALAREAGWSRGNRPTWFSVNVRMEAGAEHRPASVLITDTWQPVEVIGALMGLRARERGYRVRLPLGAEMMLIRERNGSWFCDELPAALVHERAPAKPKARS